MEGTSLPHWLIQILVITKCANLSFSMLKMSAKVVEVDYGQRVNKHFRMRI